jgi:thiol-disulfide isomerase/thioredoxin
MSGSGGSRPERSGVVWAALTLGLSLLALSACAGSTPDGVTASAAPSSAPVELSASSACAVAVERELAQPPEVIAAEQRVPAFRLTTADCQLLDSRDLIGKHPFVVVFFATWCHVCEHKLPLLKRALEQHAGQLPVLLVSLDDADTWPEVPEYLERHGLDFSPVRGHDFLSFSAGYNPFGGVPLTVVVGRSGRLVDVQLGVRRRDFERLMWAMDSAIAEPPESARPPEAEPTALEPL